MEADKQQPDQPQENNQPQVPEVQPSQPITLPDSVVAAQAEAVAPATEVPVADTPVVAQPPKPHGKRKLVILAVVIVLIIAGVVTYFLTRPSKTPTPVNTAKTAATKPKPAVSYFVDSYLAQPTTITSVPSLFTTAGYSDQFGTDCSNEPDPATATNCPPAVTAADIVYKQIGTTKAGQKIIVADAGQIGPGSDDTFIVLQTGTSTYSILGKFDENFQVQPGTTSTASQVAQDEASFRKDLAPGVTLDMTTNLPDLVFPNTFTLNKASFILPDLEDIPAQYAGLYMPGGLTGITGSANDTKASTITKVGTYQSRTVYQVLDQDEASFSVKEYYLTVNQDFSSSYALNDGFSDPNKYAANPTPTQFNWSDGSANKDVYQSNPVGCGSQDALLIAKGVTASQMTKVGTTSNGKTVYELPTTSALFQKLYNTDYSNGAGLDNKADENLTAAEMQARHGVVVVQDALGDYVVYLDTNYFQGGGCAKPVIYLYPTKTENITVQVGAKITKSDPAYGTDGWTNVTAQPDGQLTYQGKSYNSLYWEGTGLGIYPLIDGGTIVTRSQAVPTIRKQLAEQGLKQSEINDFVAYWSPRLPNTNYVRLSWLTIAQLNQLAPLNISPQPDTLLRVFLDFRGLNQPYSITPQHFSAPARQGFTVVEWGGLNLGND